ncbi:ATP-binding cassette sub-family C member 4-like [Haliotis cracherodii]|uniref:ATP-binding cassette sub-family C member 4-like n=1 Tax=Haliotis cracherodii TaxID=6455 RepID=UPI0039EA9563
MKMLQPFLIGQLIAYFSPSSVMSDTEAYLYGVCLSVTAMLQVFCNPFYFYIMARVAMRMRAAMSGLIYRKILDMNSKSFSQTTTGKIVNLLSTDVEKFTLSVPHVHYLWICPVNITLSAYCMYRLVGVSCMFGFALAAVLLLAQTIAGHAYGKLRIQVGKWSDKRVHVMTELLAGIRVVKMYCWEAPFSWLINALRDKEVRVLKWSFVLRSVSIYSAEAASRMMALAIFVGHWLCGYPPISLRNVFIVNGLLQVMNLSVFYFFYAAVESLTELVSSLKRIKNFLSIGIERSPSSNHMTPESDDDGGWSVKTTNMSACWDYTNEAPEEGKLLLDTEIDAGASFSLKDITLTIQKGELVAVVGTVGAGKTSLLAALMGDLPSSHGHISIRGSVGYFSQQPWVFSGTVRDNIVFGDEFDSKRYENVIQACALTRDLSMMSHGDQTLVGERGLLLSGGQKARITLARSVYRDDDVYLLDDPLSAVDPKVGKHIFHSCICEVLQSKTRVLVTHQLQYLKFVDRIVVMSEGQILDIGNYDELLSRDLDLSVIMSAGHGVILLPLITLLCATYQSMYAFSDWMLAQWSEDSYYMVDANMSSNGSSSIYSVNLTNSLAIRHWNTMEPEVKKYILSVVAYVFVMLVYGILVFQMTVLASQNLHNKMFRFILGSRTRFFDENPMGRILNRFARDIGLIDTSYGPHFSTIVEQFFQLLVLLGITLIVSPWLLIPIAPLLVFLVCIRYYAVQTTRDIRRLEGMAQSPVFSHVSDTINGLQTIRAMGKQEQVYTAFAAFQNTHTSAWFLYISAYRWFSMRSSFSLALYTIIVIAVCIALGNIIAVCIALGNSKSCFCLALYIIIVIAVCIALGNSKSCFSLALYIIIVIAVCIALGNSKSCFSLALYIIIVIAVCIALGNSKSCFSLALYIIIVIAVCIALGNSKSCFSLALYTIIVIAVCIALGNSKSCFSLALYIIIVIAVCIALGNSKSCYSLALYIIIVIAVCIALGNSKSCFSLALYITIVIAVCIALGNSKSCYALALYIIIVIAVCIALGNSKSCFSLALYIIIVIAVCIALGNSKSCYSLALYIIIVIAVCIALGNSKSCFSLALYIIIVIAVCIALGNSKSCYSLALYIIIVIAVCIALGNSKSCFSLALYIIIVIAVCIALGSNIPRVLLALSLSYCAAIPEPFEYFMRTSAEIENIMTSVERIVSYTTLEQEGPVTTATPPPPTWPSSGCITFTDVCLRYTATGAMVLKHLNIHIEAREKIGIVGRTGAGKSSLLAALLRLAEPEGAIIIDDINITDIGLHELRHKLSVIPQDPFLFSGDLRRNLDPFQEFPDSLIWDALHQVQLGDKVTSSPGQLDMEVAEAGGNFSVGEKQLICLARALLRRNTILILDEATANVDHKTDELIQRTIRDQFQRCTVLTIAHRLHTVMDYDRVIVLDEGEMKEYDTPYTLLKNEDGFLYQLVSQMGTEHKQELLAIAKRAFKSR